jgi:hypothetical protein
MPAGLDWAESLPRLNSPLIPSLSPQLYSGTTVWVWNVWGSRTGGSVELSAQLLHSGLWIEDVGAKVKPALSAGSELHPNPLSKFDVCKHAHRSMLLSKSLS